MADKKKILVIDDEPNVVKMIKSRLELKDYEVISALDGKEGLQKVKDENPDLIVLDIIMPEMDGYTFVQELNKERKIPIIVISASAEMKDLFGMQGIMDYIVKPFTGEELLEKIHKHLE